MSSLSPLSTSTLQNTIDTSQQQINDILKTLQTGLAINSVGDDPSNLAISEKLNSQALDAASTSSNAQNGLTYLQIAQQAYSTIITELDKVKTIANTALSGTYSNAQLQTFQDSISESINKIKDIEENTMFNGVYVFNNSNSAGSVNEHMFAITSKTPMTATTTVTMTSGGTDYAGYLSKTVNRYIEQADGTLVNGVDANLTPGANVITIKNAGELIAALDNKGAATVGKTYVLMDNIDLSTQGIKTESLLRGGFEGTLLGNGYAISGLKINSTKDVVGMFESVGGSASIKDVVLKDFNIQASNNGDVAALAGSVASTTASIDNVAVLNVNISAGWSGGAVAGINFGAITNSYSTGQVSGNATSYSIGGLVGKNYQGSVSNSFSTANVSGYEMIGGLVGNNDSAGAISASYARGNVSGSFIVGGLVGSNHGGTIDNSYSLGNVSGESYTAGLAGENTVGATISNSYSLSKVTDTTSTYAITDFTVAASGETVQGLSERPNDTYNIVYKDGSNKVWAFASADDYSKFKNSNGAIGQFYQLTDPINNTWAGRTQQLNPTTYSATATGASVANLPDSPYGTFDILYNGNAFSTKADYDAFVGGNAKIDLFYNYNTTTSTWDAMKQTLDATSGQYVYAATAQGVNSVSTAVDNGDDYNVIKTITGANAGTYAFATETDATNFNDGFYFLGNIGQFYKLDGDNWISQSAQKMERLTESQAISDGYTLIKTETEFQSLIQANLSGKYILMNDIDMSSLTLTDAAITGLFAGEFNGNGYTISNMTINTGGASNNNIGLFARVAVGSKLTNINIENASITSTNSERSGILAGRSEGGLIENVQVSGIVHGENKTGGLIGANDSATISNARSLATVSGRNSVGGLIGWNNGAVINSSVVSSGTVSGRNYVGGFFGEYSTGLIDGSYASVDVAGNNNVGGFLGASLGGTIQNSHFSGNISATSYRVGGFAGTTLSTINNCSALATVNATTNVGGFAGYNLGTISDSFASGVVSGNSVAGFVGTNDSTIERSYTTSTVTATISSSGFAGNSTGSEDASFYKNNLSTTIGSAVDANVSAMPTGTWSNAIWDLSGDLPLLNDSRFISEFKPNEANYDYSYTSTGGALGAGTFYFDTVESKNNFISINGGSKTSYADIYTYKSNGTTWDLQKISGTKTPDTYSVAAEGSASVTSRPDKEGYDVLSADGTAAFSSAADLANYNSGTYLGAISSFYEYNSTTELWDEKKVTDNSGNYTVTAAGGNINSGLVASPNVSGYTFVQTIATGVNAGTYAFDSAADRQSFVDFNAGATTAKPIDNYYKRSAITAPDPLTGIINNQWTGQSLNYNNEIGFLVGVNVGTVTDSVYGSGVASESYVGDDGVQILGNAELANSASTPLNTWDTAVWDLTGSRPTLKNIKAEGSENIAESSLPKLADKLNYTYATQDAYSTTYSKLNVALNDYTNTVATPDTTVFKGSITEAQALSSGYDAAHIIHTASEFVSKINGHLTENFIMVGDVDMASLGTFTGAVISDDFSGKFDGNGYDVKNLTINAGSSSVIEIGLFSHISGSVKNLGVTDASITAKNSDNVGVLAGYNIGKISNVQVSGTVSGGASFVGGLVGYSTGAGIIKDASSSVNVTGYNWKVGGLVGENNAIISNSSASGSVKGKRRVGGFVGFAGVGSITNSYSTGAVTGNQEIGGFIGYNYGTSVIKNSYTTGNVTAGGANVGGFAGINSSTIDATNFFSNNQSANSGSALNANPLEGGSLANIATATSSWDINSWDFTGALPTLRKTAPSVVFALNKLISNMTVSNAADSNQIFIEGKDFTTYSNDNGATWKMDILSSAMTDKNIKIDYTGVPTGATNQAVSGFDLYMGNNQNLEIKDMVLDLAGRLNFDLANEGGAKSLLQSVNSTLDYLGVKKLQVGGSIKLATAALSNKTEKNTAMNVGVKAFTDVDTAKQTAMLLKEQMRQQATNKAINQFYSSQLQVAQTLMTFSNSGYSFGSYDTISSTANGIYSGLNGVSNSDNSAVKEYYYKNLYSSLNNQSHS